MSMCGSIVEWISHHCHNRVQPAIDTNNYLKAEHGPNCGTNGCMQLYIVVLFGKVIWKQKTLDCSVKYRVINPHPAFRMSENGIRVALSPHTCHHWCTMMLNAT